MEKELKYKLECRDNNRWIPLCLQRWKPEGADLSLDELLKKLPKEDYHTQLVQLEKVDGSTILTYRGTPRWSYEEYAQFHQAQETKWCPNEPPEHRSLYRITPPLEVSFTDRS